MRDKETVTISRKMYEKLYKGSEKLAALESGGVNNWEWYGESLQQYIKDNELREDYFWDNEDEDFPL